MKKVLFVSQTLGSRGACGVGILGNLWGEFLQKNSKNFNINIAYIDDEDALYIKLKEFSPDLVIYNNHSMTSTWMYSSVTREMYNHIPHVLIQHDFTQEQINNFSSKNYHGYEYIILANPTLVGNDNIHIVNRLIPTTAPTINYNNDIPRIGYHGFATPYKGIPKIIQQVQNEFDSAIIRLNIPFAYFSDPHGDGARNAINIARSIIHKPGIKIEATHNLLNEQDLINFLAQNTINCYFYDNMPHAGLASSPDFALAAKRPIAVTNSNMLKEFLNLTPSICIENNSLKNIISYGTSPLESLYLKYSAENVLKNYEDTILKIMELHNNG